jgi:lysophospholipase L1-like esterase
MLAAAAVAAVGCLALLTVALLVVALLPATSARALAWPPWAARSPGSSRAAAYLHPGVVRESRHPADPLAGCEQKLERSQRGAGRGVPGLAIVGASFTAGVGPGNPGQSWAVMLARQLHWDAVVYGDPGAGYVRAGAGRKGPVANEISRIDLRTLAPALVIVQAGHDDIGVPLSLEKRRVEQAVALIRAEAPRARIALLTVFTGRAPSPAAYLTDRAIVTAAKAAHRNVIIMDPLAGSWTFPREHGGLHPSAAGSAWIARQVAGILRDQGVLPAPARRGTVICDAGIPAPAARTAAGSPR